MKRLTRRSAQEVPDDADGQVPGPSNSVPRPPSSSMVNERTADRRNPSKYKALSSISDICGKLDEAIKITRKARLKPGITYPTQRLGAVTRKKNELIDVMVSNQSDEATCDYYQSLISEFQSKMQNFNDACKLEEANSDDPEELLQFRKWITCHIDDQEKFLNAAKCSYKDIFNKSFNDVPDEPPEVRPEDSASQVSNGSKSSSKLSEVMRNQIIERKFKHETELRMLEEAAILKEKELSAKNEYELTQMKLKMENDRLRIKCEAAALKTIEEEYETNSNGNSWIHRERKVNNDRNLIDTHNALTLNLLKAQSLAALPKNEPDKFSGDDITRFKTFMLSFERLIESRCTEEEDKYYYLLNYTTGKANDLVRSCHSHNFGESYRTAKELLTKNFGNDYQIASKYVSKLRNWPPIKSEDVSSLEDFSIFITSCDKIMGNISSMNQLNSWQEIHDIVMKLPYDMRKQFRREAASIIKRGQELRFENLVKFVNDQIDIIKLPVLGDISDKKPKKIELQPVKGTKYGSSFITQENPPKVQRSIQVSSNVNNPCICCKKRNHVLDRCFFFLAKTLDERELFIRKNKLCFGCISTDQHQTKDCNNKLQCKKCNKFHPTSLHKNYNEKSSDNKEMKRIDKDTSETPAEQSMTVTDKEESGKCMCPAIPVTVRNRLTNKIVQTYIGLDTYSTSNYIEADLINELGICGKKEDLSVKTIVGKNESLKVTIVRDLQISSMDGQVSRIIPKLFAKSNWPFDREDSPKPGDIINIKQFENIPFNFIDKKIGILIGINMSEIMQPRQIVETDIGLYASKHLFGWAINGPSNIAKSNYHNCFKTSIVTDSTQELDTKINNLFGRDFDDHENILTDSLEDVLWIKQMENKTSRKNDQFEISLPFKCNDVKVSNNYGQVSYKFKTLLNKLKVDKGLKQEYTDFMNTMITRGFAEKVPEAELQTEEGKVWFLSHHGVRHKKKLSLRIVFDCSLKYSGLCLNDLLLKGPNLSNSLVGVLLRFRQETIAISADIEKMFYMVKLPTEDRNFLRFFWINEHGDPIQYRLTVHLFGAISSPSVASYALKQSVNREDVDETTKKVVNRNFYVDDLLVSVRDNQEGINLTDNLRCTLAKSSFNLTQFTSNSREVLDSLPNDRLSKKLEEVDITHDSLPYERALGLKWSPQTDSFGFSVNIDDDKPYTKRGLLSSIFSIYDPLFIASPTIIKAKKIFQHACSLKLSWDEQIPDELMKQWKIWLKDIQLLNTFELPRCYKTSNMNYDDCFKELHFFSDGSELAYGSVCYIRLINKCTNLINCSIVMAKVRLTPLNRSSLKTIPRIELNAAKLSVLLYEQIFKEIDVPIDECYFWTDSTAVLNYLNSETGNFQRFVANRIAYITARTNLDNWRHVPGTLNIADVLSRGISTEKFLDYKLWINGPDFLHNNKETWPPKYTKQGIDHNDMEVKKKTFQTKIVSVNSTDKLLTSTSDFYKLKCRIATLVKFKTYLAKKPVEKGISINDVKEAETTLWIYLQRTDLETTYSTLKAGKDLTRKNVLYKLKPFIDRYGMMRVGGRLNNSNECYDVKFPIIIPSSPTAETLVRDIHRNNGHMGREHILSIIRERYHIVKGSKLVKKIVTSCVVCRRVNGRPSEQLMSELPEERVTGDLPPFTSTGTDYFGPFLVSIGRGQIKAKRYGVIFSCLASRAVHIEVAASLDTDGFLNAFRRFIARRGTPAIMRSDNGTNLKSGNKEIQNCVNSWNLSKLSEHGKSKGIVWKFQPPYASNFGGIFEREIRTVRKILNSLLHEHENKVRMTDELIHTLMCEIENIMNSRPLTAVTTDIDDGLPLTPNHLLRLNNGDEFPPGIFVKSDLYSHNRWRQVQFLADLFWRRWRKEYLPLLQIRHKWVKDRRSLMIGDLVLVVDQLLPRNLWSTGRVTATTPDRHGKVRRAHVKIGRNNVAGRVLERPINKLILLCPVEDL